MDANPLWYHTIDLPDGVVTPGAFDLRGIADRLPWPEIEGKRCLDVGTYDGFMAFELERRGASEVVACDISDHNLWDWPLRTRSWGAEKLAEIAGVDKSAGFRIAAEALGSGVKRVEISIYDLSPAELDTFDVVVCGTLLLHLRDPVRALEAIRSVTGGHFLSNEEISLWPRGGPAARFMGGADVQWWVANGAGHRALLETAGFDVVEGPVPLAVAYGPAHPPPDAPAGLGERLRRARARRTHGAGVPHQALLARPAAL